MSLIGNPVAVGWKHNHAPGIRFIENAQGQMELITWPGVLGSLPTQADLDTWAVEHQAHLNGIAYVVKRRAAYRPTPGPRLLGAARMTTVLLESRAHLGNVGIIFLADRYLKIIES